MVTTTWLGVTNGSWSNDYDWSANAPQNGSGDDALVQAVSLSNGPTLADAGIGGITLSLSAGAVTFDTATLGGAAGAMRIEVTGAPGSPDALSSIAVQNAATLASNVTTDVEAYLDVSGGTLENDGLIDNAGIFESDGTLVNNGTVAGDILARGPVDGVGTIAGGTPQFFNSVAGTETIDRSGTSGLYVALDEYDVAIGGTGTFAGQIVNLSPGSQIFLASVADVGVVSYRDGVLDLTSSVGSLTLDASGAGVLSFQLAASDSGTLLTAACYAAGTRLLTEHGERPIEQVRAGDRMMTVCGAAPALQTVRWVGRARIDLSRHPHPEKLAPVRIRAHAFSGGAPRRDLLVSPDHALLVGDALVPAYLLCNGATIAREPAHGTIAYWHIEFDRHALVLAEGVAAESYLDTGNRAAFDNAGTVQMLHPDFSPRRWDRDACRRLLLGGDEVVAAHALLLARAEALGWRRSGDPAPRLWANERLLRPAARSDGLWRFRLPRGAREVRLRSRSFVPSEHDRAADDHRALGLPVIAIHADGVPLPLGGDGWHAAEAGWRWTDGDAALAVPPGTGLVEVHVQQAAARYWAPPVPRRSHDSVRTPRPRSQRPPPNG